MEIIKSTRNNLPVLQLKGRFDAHEVEPVNTWLVEQSKAGNIKLIVNLEGVNFIDSTALSALVRGLKLCREQNGDLHVCSLLQPVRVIFELTRLDKAFDIFQTEEEAAKGF
ncbi:MAG: STAS domain-containing protein [Anaerolineales bacterium]|jgi:anti-sigma B factor antagonist|uniref:STAS domain-containing protein n=1 Tax=Candidatus Villigracilis vicinus TaxID=3140679 RepID=UPI003134DDAD|nr:STAS domain-containing protein [Anaerolineales bacterium]MBK7448687.1 STAS domain-containing protein [Anaerolineales bacterium]MBK9782687.1 STAS domain-containing protein [Anaerolineales bacterium]